ncbi:MAG: SPOR domain-containing protein [Alphaproteobacteria bacterium]
MSQGDQFHQYGYDHYLKAPKKQGKTRGDGSSYGSRGVVSSLLYALGSSNLFRRLHSPVVAGSVLVCAVLLFVGVVAMTYFSGDTDEALPVVRAEMANVKEMPHNPGGMTIPHSQSTVLAREEQPSADYEAKVVEDLLARQSQQDLISKEEIFDRATRMPLDSTRVDGALSDGAADERVQRDSAGFLDESEGDLVPFVAEDDLAALNAQAKGAVDVLSVKSKKSSGALDLSSASVISSLASEPADEPARADLNQYSEISELSAENEKPQADGQDILQKIGSSKVGADQETQDDGFSSAFTEMTAKAALEGKPKAPKRISVSSAAQSSLEAGEPAGRPNVLHGAGQSSATLDYVRGVLGTDQMQDVEPAAGASSDIEIGAGVYFVQLASITDAKRAASEWAKMQGQYSVLESSNFRVQKAALPAGTFYRIQAGPMSKASAERICDALKQANKPGGCLVVK